MKTKLTKANSLEFFIDLSAQRFRADDHNWSMHSLDILVAQSGGEDMPDIRDFLPAARPHSSLKLRTEERVLMPQHFNEFPEDQKVQSRTRVLNPSTASAA
jgi:hypothetical protein